MTVSKSKGAKLAASRDVRWLMLVHQLPARPAYNRVKVWRLLRDAGAVSLRNSVYVLPNSAFAHAAMTDILAQIERHGGDGLLYEARVIAGMRDDEIRAIFNTARDADYHVILADLRQCAQRWSRAGKPKDDPVQSLLRISARLAGITKLDFFGASGRSAAEVLLAELEHSAIAKAKPQGRKRQTLEGAGLTGKTWVTRRDIHVDRIACAWLIKRFIDPQGTLKFVPTKQYQPLPGEYRYDMQDGEFTHEGDKCSFEVLVIRAGITDPALKAMAEIVHDIDLKDGKFCRPETQGISHIVSGICRTQGDDGARLLRGTELFDDIYEQFRRLPR